MRRYVRFFAALACWTALSVHAARPLVTDDARIVDPKSCQLESYYRHLEDGHEWVALPGCNPFGNLELTLGGSRSHIAGESIQRIAVQGKTVLQPLTDRWGLALAVGATETVRPSRHLATMYVNVPISFAFPDSGNFVHVNVGADRNRESGRNHFTWGIGSEIALRPTFGAVAETFGTNEGRPLWQAGLRWSIVPQRVQIDATIGDQFGGDARFWSIGLRLLSPPLW